MDDLPGEDDHSMDAVGYDFLEDSIQHGGQDDLFSNSNEMEVEDERNSDDEDSQVHEQNTIVVNRAIVDIDYVVQNYKGLALLARLMYVAEVCPPLRVDAICASLDYLVKETQDTTTYNLVYQKIDHFRAANLLGARDLFPSPSQEWIEKTLQKSNNRLDIVNAEFRRQKDDGVKESIRRAMDDVFQQHLAMGNIHEALKLYSRGIREYCTTPIYLIQMLINWITVSVYAEQWPKLTILIPQAERAVTEAVERDNVSSSSGISRPSGLSVPAQKPTRTFRESVAQSNAKISAVAGLLQIKNGNFKAAANKFIAIELEHFLYPELLSANDVATYGALCSLATFTRDDLKKRVIGSSLFRKFLESEPKLVELLNKFVRNQFGACLDILNDLKDMLLLNVYLAPHVSKLFTLIRRRAIVQYFEPYLNADMNAMAVEFRTTVDDLEDELVELIRARLLNARIDSFTKTLQLKLANRQLDVQDNAIKATRRLDHLVHALLIRSALQQQDCIVGAQENGRRRRDQQEEIEPRDGSPSSGGSNPGGRLLAHVKSFVGGNRDPS